MGHFYAYLVFTSVTSKLFNSGRNQQASNNKLQQFLSIPSHITDATELCLQFSLISNFACRFLIGILLCEGQCHGVTAYKPFCHNFEGMLVVVAYFKPIYVLRCHYIISTLNSFLMTSFSPE